MILTLAFFIVIASAVAGRSYIAGYVSVGVVGFLVAVAIGDYNYPSPSQSPDTDFELFIARYYLTMYTYGVLGGLASAEIAFLSRKRTQPKDQQK